MLACAIDDDDSWIEVEYFISACYRARKENCANIRQPNKPSELWFPCLGCLVVRSRWTRCVLHNKTFSNMICDLNFYIGLARGRAREGGRRRPTLKRTCSHSPFSDWLSWYFILFYFFRRSVVRSWIIIFAWLMKRVPFCFHMYSKLYLRHYPNAKLLMVYFRSLGRSLHHRFLLLLLQPVHPSIYPSLFWWWKCTPRMCTAAAAVCVCSALLRVHFIPAVFLSSE